MRSILAHPLLKNIDIKIISQLLVDKTTGGNIIWGTDNYELLGDKFKFDQPITIDLLTGKKALKLRARVHKSNDTKKKRTKGLAEVYTPSWVCNFQNSKVDEIWFEKENVFNKPIHKTSWVVSKNPIEFSGKKTWEKYVLLKGIEITCGEAPYMVSRYDTTTGKFIDVHRRIGFLDRKLRVINENVHDEETWFKWVLKAYESSFGYEYQGDSLFIARVNLLLTFIENFKFKWNREPSSTQLRNISNVISWNVWQMDGLNDSLISDKTIPCIIRSWRQKKNICFKDIKKGEKGTMRFDYSIFNPPYQNETIGENKSFAPPIYHEFLDAAFEISDRTIAIHPARCLFNAGSTPKEWNEKMLKDEHFKVLLYEPKSKDVFANTDIKGGVAITYRDSLNEIGPTNVFVAYEELRTIMQKAYVEEKDSLMNIIFVQNRYLLDEMYLDYPETKQNIGSDGKDKRFRSNAFDKIKLFSETPINQTDIKVIGLINNKRVWRYFPIKYFDQNHENWQKYKVFLPAANGSGALGEIYSTPLVGEPLVGYTQTFIGIGAFDKKYIAENAMKYIKTKFCRTMLGILKITQSNNKETWRYVPIQDFTNDSDIDWSKSITEIDQQLYKKYGLTQKEIDFIETKVRSMDDEIIEKDGED